MVKLGAKELRTSEPTKEELISIKKNPIYIILDNVLDTYNVGSIFRLADAVAAEKVFLCGETLTPPNTRIKKASINTWQWVDWSYASTAVEVIQELKTQNSKLKTLVVEQDARSVPYTQMKVEFPLAVVVGNETYGVSQEVLDMVDEIVEIPMFGVNKSLNVMVSLGIILFEIMEQLK
ncbi:MAG: TrmH family RNA methyltransferase [Patescibacteria group bacterium]|nr:TrmH family RNA methyltransferase [Patescibacteria group bacterium]MCL5095853.1 TrmH family RNA methyltransferase [Patescibacteria group bacterium]